jgi:parallel beta helix pectate lyase-like protein
MTRRNLVGVSLLLSLLALPLSAKDFYISPIGDNEQSGTRAKPWQSLTKVNSTAFQPGDRILLEGGTTFSGPLELGRDDTGTPARNLVVTSYGVGRATIDGGNGRAISIDGCSHVLVQRLELIGSGRKSGNTSDGLYLAHSAGSTVDHVEVSGFQHSGVEISGTEDARITNVHAHRNGFAGINSGGDRSKNLYIGYCLTDNNPGDPTIRENHSGNGIVVSYVDGALVEHCESRYNGWDMPWTGNGPVGIWTHNADRVVIQHCVAHHNRSTASDGGGFDFDGGVTNSILQYNYSHDNYGSGYLICQYDGAPRFANNTVRYNISQDDGLFDHNSGIFVWVGGVGMESTLVHNNTIWNTKGSAVAYGISEKYKDHLPEITFYNNILVSQGPQIFNETEEVGKIGVYRGNLYWAMGERGFRVDGYESLTDWAAATGQEKVNGRVVGVFADPALRKGGPGLLTNPAGLYRLVEYQLLKDSPAIGAGLDLRSEFGIDAGPRDFYGNVALATAIGADAGTEPR